MAAGLHLLTVKSLPSAYVPDVLSRSWESIRDGAAEGEKKAVALLGFQINGENKIIAVVKGDLENVMIRLNAAAGETIEVTCVPLISYEIFAKNSLGVNPSSCAIPEPKFKSSEGTIFMLETVIEPKGAPFGDLTSAWKEEAEALFSDRARGALDAVLYKVVAQKRTITFANFPSAELCDAASFELPLLAYLGDQVTHTAKSLTQLH